MRQHTVGTSTRNHRSAIRVAVTLLALAVVSPLPSASLAAPSPIWTHEVQIEGPGWIAYRLRGDGTTGGWEQRFTADFGPHELRGASCWPLTPVGEPDYGFGITWTNAAGYTKAVVRADPLGINLGTGALTMGPDGESVSCIVSSGGNPRGEYWAVFVATAAGTKRVTARLTGGAGLEVVAVNTGGAGGMLAETDFPARVTAQVDAGYSTLPLAQAGVVDGGALPVQANSHLVGLFIGYRRTDEINPTVVTKPMHISYVDAQGTLHDDEDNYALRPGGAPPGAYEFRVNTWINTDTTAPNHAMLIYGDVELP